MESIVELEEQARILAAKIASAKAVKQAENGKKVVTIPLQRADGEVEMYEVSGAYATALLKDSSIAKAVQAQVPTEGKAEAKPGNVKHPKLNKVTGGIRKVAAFLW